MHGKSERFEEYDSGPGSVLAAMMAIAVGTTRSIPAMGRSILIVIQSGTVQLRVNGKVWVLGGGGGLWLPARTPASIMVKRSCVLTSGFLPRSFGRRYSEAERIAVSPLLRALLESLAEVAAAQCDGLRARRLGRLLIDEIRFSPLPDLELPWPRSPRLRSICEAILKNPVHSPSMSDVVLDAAMSERTLARRFPEETGLSFAGWKRNARILRALTEIANGESIYSAAIASGYSTASALCTAFKRVMGTTLRGYFTSHRTRWEYDESVFR